MEIIIAFLPMILLQVIYSIFIYIVAKRMQNNYVVPVILSIIPIFGYFYFIYFWFYKVFKVIFDRLERLES